MHRNKHRETNKMRRQRNIFQIKKEKPEQNSRKRTKMETKKNLPDVEFKTLVMSMLSELSR